MNGRAFVDTNVLIYAVGPAGPKREQAEALLRALAEPVVSVQVINEFVSVCLRKSVLPPDETRQAARDWMDALIVEPVNEGTVRWGLRIHRQHGLSWWDSLIVAAAAQAGCPALYSEDMSDGQEIERVRIEDPFGA